ncbi:flagellar hook-associated protein FlgL [Limisphaera sp. VF-2]|jgi:flagellar hook-associated protein 3 FlgL|uniref:flagellar hook-associated protein FlgL n=1 Tax=Limisphaera sp. VF-2 TaxID=3400418 RepID=UPI0017591889|nr:flagellar hook-associated protein FlgL [Limisphaera sp.]
MRVTGNTFAQSLLQQLNSLTGRQYRLQTQVATGQRIQNPEDDPAAIQRALGLHAEAATLQQYRANLDTLKERANVTFDALKALKKVSDRATELATLADGTRSRDELRIYAAEVTQLIQHAVQILNQKHRGAYLFGGTRTDQPPFVLATDADGRVTSVTYQGNTEIASTPIEQAVTLALDIPGANPTGTGPRGLVADSRTGADLFAHLIALQDRLLAGDTDAIARTVRPALLQDEENLLYHIGNQGALQTRIETAASLADKRLMALDQAVSREVDADLAETLVRLNQAQYAYQAALQSGAAILRQSLLNFLR